MLETPLPRIRRLAGIDGDRNVTRDGNTLALGFTHNREVRLTGKLVVHLDEVDSGGFVRHEPSRLPPGS